MGTKTTGYVRCVVLFSYFPAELEWGGQAGLPDLSAMEVETCSQWRTKTWGTILCFKNNLNFSFQLSIFSAILVSLLTGASFSAFQAFYT